MSDSLAAMGDPVTTGGEEDTTVTATAATTAESPPQQQHEEAPQRPSTSEPREDEAKQINVEEEAKEQVKPSLFSATNAAVSDEKSNEKQKLSSAAADDKHNNGKNKDRHHHEGGEKEKGSEQQQQQQHHIHSLKKPSVDVTVNNSARGRAKIIADRLNRSAHKNGAYIPIKYEDDRIAQEQMDIATVLELRRRGKKELMNTNIIDDNHQQTLNPSSASSSVSFSHANQQMLLVGRRGTIGNAPIIPTALRVHPRGFKMLSSGSPMERGMKSYFRLPPQPPKRIAEEHLKLRTKIKQQVIAAEQRRLKQLQAHDAETSMFGGVATANTVSTTVTTTVKRPNGTEEVITETIYGKQLDGFLLLENSVGLPGVHGYDADGNPLYSVGSSGGGGATYYQTVTDKYYRERERQLRREERAQAAYEKNMRKQAKIEHKLGRMRRREEQLARLRSGGGGGVGDETKDDTTFMTGTKMTNPDLKNDGDGEDDEEDDYGDLDDDISSDEDGDEVDENGGDHGDGADEEEEEDDELDLNRPPVDAEAEAAKAPADPSLAVEANINDRNLIGVVADDLPFFSRLVFVDAGENRLLVSDFAKLPALEELHLHCNTITQLSDLADVASDFQNEKKRQQQQQPTTTTATRDATLENETSDQNNQQADNNNGDLLIPPFSTLHSLNLSFNRIPPHELLYLAHTPHLTRLDLSNNNLKTLTIEFALSGCPNVTHLALEGNKFRNALHVFSCLAVMPCLVEVNLNDNLFEAIPSTTEMLAYLPPLPQTAANMNMNESNDDSDDTSAPPPSSYAIFPALEALGIANNKLQFVEDVFPVIQFPQLSRIVLWGNPLVKQSRDALILTTELKNAGITEIIMGNPTLPKRHPQDFYSTRPPNREGEMLLGGGANGKISNTFGNMKRKTVSRGTVSGAEIGGGDNNNNGVSSRAFLSEMAAETQTHVQQIFNETSNPPSQYHQHHNRQQQSSKQPTVALNGPGGAFIRLPLEIHSDYSHSKGLKGQGLVQHNLPTVLPSQRRKRKNKNGNGGGSMGAEERDLLTSSTIPMTTTTRLRQQIAAAAAASSATTATTSSATFESREEKRSVTLAKPTGGTFASLTAATSSQKARSQVTRDEQNDLKSRKAEEERWLPPIDSAANSTSITNGGRVVPSFIASALVTSSASSSPGGGKSGKRAVALDSSDHSLPYYLGGANGGMTDGSTTQQALNELRRLVGKR